MRKLFFAVVLVSASFAGGAVVNGPGLRWAQTKIYEKLGIDDDEADTAVSDPDKAKAQAQANASAEAIPARSIPPLVLDHGATVSAAAKPAPVAAKAPLAEPKSTPTPPPTPVAALSAPPDAPGLTPTAPDDLGPLDPVPPLSASADAEPKSPSTPLAASRDPEPPSPASEPAGPVDDAPRTKAVADPAVRRASAPSPSPDESPDASPGDWAGVRETMRGLGVSRYGVEGDPSGRVRFHCVIPLAGRRAVGQHFEAEGDDDLQAARAALKRVALWKATEGATNATP